MSYEYSDLRQLDRAARGIQDVQAEIKGASAKVGPDSDAAVSALQGGWALAGALQQITTGWQQELQKFSDQIGEFGPRLSQTAADFRAAEHNAHAAVERVQALWAHNPTTTLTEA